MVPANMLPLITGAAEENALMVQDVVEAEDLEAEVDPDPGAEDAKPDDGAAAKS